jgi:hypothetical protein
MQAMMESGVLTATEYHDESHHQDGMAQSSASNGTT